MRCFGAKTTVGGLALPKSGRADGPATVDPKVCATGSWCSDLIWTERHERDLEGHDVRMVETPHTFK